MSTQVQIRKGNTAQTAAFTGVLAEITVDTDKKVLVVHDGTTAGGNPLIKANASITTGQILTSNGSHLLALSNTGTAGTYGNASYIPVVTTDAYGRISSVTNTAIAISSGVVTGVMTFAQGGANATSYTTGSLLTSNGTAFVSVANTGTAGTYGNAAYHPVITTDAYGRVSSVTNTLVQISTTQITSGVLPFAQGGANATSYTTGQFLTSNGTALVSVANTGTAGTYANAAYIPVITTDAYGRVSAVTNTAVAIDTSQLTSGTVADARLASVGTAGTYANAAYVPVITTDSKGRITAITNTAIAIDTSQLTSGTVADARLPTKGTAGTYANAAYVPVITTDAYGRVTGVTNTAIAVDTSQITSGTIADARLPTKGTAGTYANAAYIPVITTDAYGRVTGVTNTAVAITASQVSGGTISGDLSVTGNLVVSGTQTFVNTSTVSTNDSLIKLAANNTVSDVLDIGFYGQSNTGSSVTYHGLVRQAAGNFFLFKGLPTDPTTNTLASGSLTAANTATIRANLTGGTVSSLSAAIGIADGGTNQTSFTNGIVAYNGTALATLANTGTAGTYANAAYVPVITTDAYGRVSSVTNTAIAINSTAVTGVFTFAQGGANATSYTTGSLLTSNGTAFVSVANTGTAGTYANAAYVPVITTDSYGRVSAVTNTAIAIDTSQLASGTIADARLAGVGTAGTYANAAYVPVITTDSKGRVTAITNTAIAISATAVSGIHTFAQGGTNAASYTTGSLLTSNGTAFVSVSNTGTAGTYANASYVPVITTDAYGRVSSVTNTLIQISTSQVTSGVLPFAQGGSNNTTYTTGAILTSNGTAFVALANTGTAGTYANAAYVPVITTDAYGRVSAVTNTAVAIDTSQITSGTVADARLPTKGTAGTYANAAYIPVITTDAYGRVSAVTNTAIAIDTAAITSGTLADARLPATGTAGTYANAAYVPVITTDSKGRVTAITNTAIVISAAAITSGTLAVAQGGTGVTTSTGTGAVVLNTAPTLTSINVTNTTVSTSNITGAITVSGGIGVKGNVSANGIIFDDGTRQTTAGASLGDALALAIALG
jgi:Major tropism determinant N-terminal domain